MTAPLADRLWLALTLVVATAGGAAFSALGWPVAWLSGPMIAVAALAMTGAPVRFTPTFRDLAFLLAGTSLGSTVTPDALAAIARYPASILGLTISVVASVVVSSYLLERLFGWDRPTAFLASVPGALSMVMALAAESSGDIRRIALVQSVRLFVLVAVLPHAITHGIGVTAAPPAHETVSAAGLAVLFTAALALTAIFSRFRIANPTFLGAMLSSTGLHVSGLVPGEVPDLVMQVGTLLIGAFCGVRFVGTTLRMLVTTLVPGLCVLGIALAIAAAFSFGVHRLTGLDLSAVLVAFAPGGLEAMVLMGAAMGLDTLYISTHHILRAIGLMLLTPLVAPVGRAIPKA